MHFSLTEFNAVSKANATAVTDRHIRTAGLDQEQRESEDSKPELELFSLKHTSFRDSELKSIGWKRPENAPTVTCPESSLWVDNETGELFTEKEAREYGIFIGPSGSLRAILVQSIIQLCPPGKREFVRYILRLRNTRGGLIVDLKTALDRWIDYVNPTMHSTDRARKRNTLEQFLYKRGILKNNQTFAPELQFIAHSTKSDYIGEESSFIRAFPVVGKPGCGFTSNSTVEYKRLMEWDKFRIATNATKG